MPLRNAWNVLRAFAGDGKGAVAPIFAVSSFALLIAVAASIDVSRLSEAQESMQQSTDATAIALAMERASGLEEGKLSDLARQQVSAQLPTRLRDGLRIVGARIDGTRVTVRTTASVRNSFAGIVGRMETTVVTEATADYGVVGTTKKAEIALVVDSSGVMRNGEKLATLNRSMKPFFETAQRISEGGDNYKIAVIPFAEHVKVGQSQRAASWLKFDGQGEMPKLTGQQEQKIKADQKAAQKFMRKVTQLQIDRTAWEGCVTDMPDPTDLTFDAAHQHPGARCHSPEWQKTESNAISGLTHRYEKLTTQLSAIQAEGCANVAIGAVWGMGALLPQGPFGASAPYSDKETKKIMILFSGGPNTVSRQFGVCLGGDNRDQRMTDATKSVCDKIKAKGVTIYTVNIVDGDKEVLHHCASDPRKALEARTTGELPVVIEQISKDVLVAAPRVARLVR